MTQTRICPHCETTVPYQAIFCPSCTAMLDQPAQPATRLPKQDRRGQSPEHLLARAQRISLLVGALAAAVVVAFPPWIQVLDSVLVGTSWAPVWSAPAYSRVNTSMLSLELLLVVMVTAIAAMCFAKRRR